MFNPRVERKGKGEGKVEEEKLFATNIVINIRNRDRCSAAR